MSSQHFEAYMRSRLADHSEPADEGGWEALSADLIRRAKRKVLYRRLYYGCAAAAAVVLLLLVLTPPGRPGNQMRPSVGIAAVYPQIIVQQPGAKVIQPIRERRRKAPVAATPAATPAESPMVETVGAPTEPAQTTQSHQPDTMGRQLPLSRHDRQADRSMYTLADAYYDPPQTKHRLSYAKGWTVALASSCANAAGEAPFAYNRLYLTSSDSYVENQLSTIPSSDAATEWQETLQYAPPVSVGINFQKELYPWLSIGLGLNYTLLQSKLSIPYLSETYITRQYLHYVGLPASVLFNFVSQPKLRVYASVGGAVEKAVAAYYASSSGSKAYAANTESVQVSGLQWSVGAGIGVEYRFSKIFGIYIEPGAGYYFDCNQPRSVRTAQPTLLKIELGLRARI